MLKMHSILKKIFLPSLYSLIIFVTISLIFSKEAKLLGQDAGLVYSVLKTFFETFPQVFLKETFLVTSFIFFLCILLHGLTIRLPFFLKISLTTIIFLSCILRLVCMYPATAEDWFLNQQKFFSDFVFFLSSLSETSKLRFIIENLPFLLLSFGFFLNLSYFLIPEKNFSFSSLQIKMFKLPFSFRSGFLIEFLFFIAASSACLYYGRTFFQSELLQNNVTENKPHVFIFAIDSLRYDKISPSVMPFLSKKIPNALINTQLIVGVPRTFPSWVELATGDSSLTNGVRTMFPSRRARLGEKTTIFSEAQKNNYHTVMVSDFAGDIFPRYPFGARQHISPTSNLSTMIQLGFFSSSPLLLGILSLPRLNYLFDGFLENNDIADPRIVSRAFLTSFENVKSPLLTALFFSTAHFPYAVPAPFLHYFQSLKNGKIIYHKNPDQQLNTSAQIAIDSGTILQTRALYDSGLVMIDREIEKLWMALEEKSYLKNAIIVILGDHGENLYEGKLGMGHGDGTNGEYSIVTPFVVFSFGQDGALKKSLKPKAFVRMIDVAPTLADLISIPFPHSKINGCSIFRTCLEKDLPDNRAYTESGLWFTNNPLSPESRPRIQYPTVLHLLEIDLGYSGEFFLSDSHSQSILSVKERAWSNSTHKLVLSVTTDGVSRALYDRVTDPAAEKNLLANPDPHYHVIADKLNDEIDLFLAKKGVEKIITNENKVYYVETHF